MVTIIIVGILLILYSLLSRKHYKIAFAFAFVFLIMGFQSGIEGDITRYEEDYNFLARTGVFYSRTMDTEPVIPWLMRFWGFVFPWWFYVASISLLQCTVLVIFIERYAHNKYKFLAAILFYFTFNMMLMQMMALRQAFAIENMILAFLLIDNKKILGAILCCVIAFFSHNSAIILVPFLLVFCFVLKKTKSLQFVSKSWFPIITVCLYLVIYVAKESVLNDYLVAFAMLDDDYRLASYLGEESMEQAFNISWLIVFYNGLIIFLVSWYAKFADNKMRVFCLLSILAAFGDMLLFGIGALPRINMYFIIFNLVVYPAVAMQLRNRYGNIVAIFFLVVLVGYAVKTSLPYIITVGVSNFGSYKLLFF